jgi:hypothetical protein
MKFSLPVAGALAFVVTGLLGATAYGAETGRSDTRATHDVSRNMSTLQRTADHPVPTETYARIAGLLSDSPREHSDAPGRSELGSIGQGRVPLNQFRERLTVIPTTDGQVCFSADVYGRGLVAGCVPRFEKDGAWIDHLYGTGAPTELFGFVSDDVTSVSVTTADGTTSDARITNNAFWWTGPVESRIVKMTTVRDGESYSEVELFARQDWSAW